MVKTILKEERVEVPEGVSASVKSKVVAIEGPLGRLVRSFQKVPVQILPECGQDKRVRAITVRIWFAKSKPKSCVSSISRHIRNMIVGVTKGYTYVMKFGYNLLPLQPTASEDGKQLQVTNYLGQKRIRKVQAVGGSKVSCKDAETKKEIEVTGIDREAVGLTCSLIHQSCRPKDKDKRQFMDGIYLMTRSVNA